MAVCYIYQNESLYDEVELSAKALSRGIELVCRPLSDGVKQFTFPEGYAISDLGSYLMILNLTDGNFDNADEVSSINEAFTLLIQETTTSIWYPAPTGGSSSGGGAPPPPPGGGG